jgi:hypothetical protein
VNDFETTDPNLALEAFGWDPKTVTRSSNKKREWKCKFGHIWTASLNSRTNMQSGCPVCDNRKLLSGFNDLLTLFPQVATQADGWDPSQVLAGTHKKLTWICSESHKWSSVVKDRTLRGDGCPSCAVNGFNPSADGFLYFIFHLDWEMFQIGITNNLEERVSKHQRSGWTTMEVRGPMEGQLTRQLETASLRTLLKRGAVLGKKGSLEKFDGYTEAWTKSSLQVTSIKQILDWVYEDESEVNKI